MSHKSIKLSKALWERIVQSSAAAGYSSPEEFVEHVLNRELKKLEQAEPQEQIVEKLRGLGYLD